MFERAKRTIFSASRQSSSCAGRAAFTAAAQEVVQDRTFEPRKFNRSTLARPRQVYCDVARDPSIFDDEDTIGKRHGLRHVVGDKYRGEALEIIHILPISAPASLVPLRGGRRLLGWQATMKSDREAASLSGQNGFRQHAVRALCQVDHLGHAHVGREAAERVGVRFG